MYRKIFYTIVSFFIICYGKAIAAPVVPVAQNGVIDLRHETFTNTVALDGDWLFYWHQLLSPVTIKAAVGQATHFPELWNSGKSTLPSFGYATYQLKILLPKNREALKISVPDMYSAYLLFANGKKVASNGSVSTSAEGFEPHWRYQALTVPDNTDTLKLVLQIANFVHSKGGITKSLVIGKREVIELNRERAIAIDLVLAGCLLMGGLFFLGLYLLGNRDKAILLFSLYAIVYSYRMVGVDNYILHTLFPHLDWYITARLEYMSLFSGIGLFGLYCNCIYPKDGSDQIIYTISGACFLFTVISLFTPAVFFTRLINPFLVVMVFCLVYVPYLYIRAYRRKRPGSVYALLSSLSLMSVFAISLLHYWRIIPQMQLLTFLGYISFFFLQSLVLSHRVSFVLKQASEQAEQGLIAKTEFLSTMSHEIRTPLNSVIGMSHLLLRNDPRDDQKEQLDVMIFSANNLLNIVNDILDYSKIEAGKITFEHIEMDIAAMANNLITSMRVAAQDKDVDLQLQVDQQLKNKVLSDPTRLSQVLTNLVHNAIKFTSKGQVLVSISVKQQDEKEVTLNIAVKDTGIGISKEKQSVIFERFTQADSSTSRGFGGTGLGLAISKRILELQGTSLQLTSEEGVGSTFYFVQTFQKSSMLIEQQRAGGDKVGKDTKAFTGIAILLVEDNPLNVMVAQSFLKRWGATVDVAVNGQEALNILNVDKHRLILMDLHMPVMDGYEASQKIREQGITIPIIALTATLPAEIQGQLSVTGIDDIVVKPFLPDELYSKVFHYVFKN